MYPAEVAGIGDDLYADDLVTTDENFQQLPFLKDIAI